MTASAPRDARTAPRDPRLDFFRGLAMIIIFIAHLPGNPVFLFIPARFGFSSAAEWFVFCSGLASAYAFGRLFERSGLWAGTKRVWRRIMQVYAVHLALMAAMIALSWLGGTLRQHDYLAALSAHKVLTPEGLWQALTLRLLPDYLDILPMYLVLLALMPPLVALHRMHAALPFGVCAGLWLGAQLGWLNLPNTPERGGAWFFNPFGWQLLFYTGYAFGAKWLHAPPLRFGKLFYACLALVIGSIPLNFWGFTDNYPALAQLHTLLVPQGAKTTLAAPLYGHFLASAYVALVLIKCWRIPLARAKALIRIGQHTLPAFAASLLLAWGLGMALDATCRSTGWLLLANLVGIGAIGLMALWLEKRKSTKRLQNGPA